MKFPFLRGKSRTGAQANAPVRRRALKLESLEERILWDASMDVQDDSGQATDTDEQVIVQQSAGADAGETGEDQGSGDQGDQGGEAEFLSAQDAVDDEGQHDASAAGESADAEETFSEQGADAGEVDVEDPAGDPMAASAPMDAGGIEEGASSEQHTTDVVVVDSAIEDHESLVEDIRSSSTGQTSIHVIDSATDGVRQVSDILAAYRGLDALHIVSHGDKAELRIGSDTISADNVDGYRDALSAWSASFADGGDILIYGCDVAAGAAGEHLVDRIADATGQDVAASVDDTGTRERGGDVDLEYATGAIEAAVVMSDSSHNNWQGVLASGPAGSVSVPTEVMIDASPFDFSLTFDNVGPDTGFVPFGDLIVGPGADLDIGSLSYLGNPLAFPSPPAEIATWDAANSQWLDGNNNPVSTHPLQRANDTGVPDDMTPPDGIALGLADGARWHTVELPFGSFVETQPVATITGQASFNRDTGDSLPDAVVGTPIDFHWRPGFVLGDDENGGSEPDIGDWTTSAVTPSVIQIEKTSDLPENETVSGPNFPATYTITLEVAGGEQVDNTVLTDYLPANAIYRGDIAVTAVNGYMHSDPISIQIQDNSNTYGITDFVGPRENLRFVIDFGTIEDTNTDEAVEFEIVYSVYFPLQDTDGTDLIAQSGGDNNDPALNESTVTGTHNGNTVTDTGDNDAAGPDGNVDDGDLRHDVHAIAVQKGFENITTDDGLTRPNDILRWTVEFQVSDYFAFDNIVIDDLLGDGLRFLAGHSGTDDVAGSPGDPSLAFDSRLADGFLPGAGVSNNGAPTLTIFAENGGAGFNDSSLGPVIIDPLNYSTNAIGNPAQLTGETRIEFDVSEQLRDSSGDGILVGDLFNGDLGTSEGVHGQASNSPGDPSGDTGNHPQREAAGTRGVLVFYSLVLEEYEGADGIPADVSIDVFDPLVNEADIRGDALDTDLATVIGTKSEDTSAGLQASGPTIVKTIYAVNGIEVLDADDIDPDNLTEPDLGSTDTGSPAVVTAQAGDLITYRIRAELPSANVENLRIADFFPIPVHDVSDFGSGIANAASISGGVDPVIGAFAANQVQYGEDFDLHQVPGLNPAFVDPTVVIDNVNNSLVIEFGQNYDEPDDDEPQDVIIDFLITLRVNDVPVDDPFLFTNQSQVLTDNSFGEVQTTSALTFIEYAAPALTITKGVLATSNSNTTLRNPDGTPYVEPDIDNDGDAIVDPIDFSATTPGTSGNSIIFNDSFANPDAFDLAGRMDANAVGVDGDDWVRYGITVENTGGGEAHDVVIRDTFPGYTVGPAGAHGYNLPTDGSDPFDDGGANFGINLQVYSGTGAKLVGTTDFVLDATADYEARIVGGELVITFNEDPLIQVLDGARVENAINGSGSVTPGDEVYLITYDLQLDNDPLNVQDDVIVGTNQDNTAIIEQYFAEADPTDPDPSEDERINRGGDADGDGFVDPANFDTASVTVPEPVVEKILVNTGITNETDANLSNPSDDGVNSGSEAVIGETVQYRVTITVPEGIVPDAVLRDTLDSGLALVSIDKVTRSSGDITLSGASGYAEDPDQPGAGDLLVQGLDNTDVNVLQGVTLGGNFQFELPLGEVFNGNTDNNVAETITIEYTAIVLNVPANQSTLHEGGPQLNNAAQLRWDGPDDDTTPGDDASERSNTSRAVTVHVIEPRLEVDKQVTVGASGPSDSESGDAFDAVTYTIVIRHHEDSETDAFDATFSDEIPAQLTGLSFTAVDQDSNDVSALFDLTDNSLTSDAPFDLLFGDTITISVSGTLHLDDDGLSPPPVGQETVLGDLISNTAHIAWTSLDGDFASGNLANDFVDTDDVSTSGFDEALTDSERTGDAADGPGGTVNDYRHQDDAGIMVPAASVDKEVIATSVDGPNNNFLEQATIGETATYRVTVTLPEGFAPNARLVDDLEQGLEFVSLNLVQARNDGAADAGDGIPDPVDAAAASVLSGAIAFNDGTYSANVTGSSGDPGGETLVVDLGDIRNKDDDNAVVQTLVFEYTVRVVNITQNVHGDALDNSAVFVWDPDDDPGTDNDRESNAGRASVDVVEPRVTITKEAEFEEAVVPDFNGTSLVGDAGDNVYFRITFSADPNRPTAHEVRLFDDLSALDDFVDFTDPDADGIVSVNDNLDGGTPLGAGDFEIVDLGTPDARLQLVSADGVDMGPDEGTGGDPRTISVIIVGKLRDNVFPEQVLGNLASVEWTSLEGESTDERTGPSGTDGQGTADDPPNDYTAEDDASVFVDTLVPAKVVVATSEGHTGSGEHDAGNEDVAIGEIVRYRLWVEIPEGTTTDLVIRDNLPDGMRFLDDGTAHVALLSDGGIGLSSSTLSGTALNVAGSDPLAMAAPTFDLPDAAVSADAQNNVDTYGSGTDVFFKVGTLENTGSNDGPEYVVIEFNALVLNESANQNGATLTNTVDVFADQNASGSSLDEIQANDNVGETSPPVTVDLVAPRLDVEKEVRVSDPGDTSGDSGDTASYVFTVTHAGASTADAFDLDISDALPPEFDAISVSAEISDGGTPVDVSSAFSIVGDTLSTTGVVNLELGQTLVITVSGELDQNTGDADGITIDAGETVTNTVNLTWTSLPGAGTTGNPTGSDTPGASSDGDGERDGSDAPDGGALNNHFDSDTATFTVPGPSFDKRLADPLQDSATVGEFVDYELVITVPEGRTSHVVVEDSIPNGMAFISAGVVTAAASSVHLSSDFQGSISFIGTPGVDVNHPTDNGDLGQNGEDVVFSLGDVIADSSGDETADNTFVLRVRLLVLDVPANDGLVDGIGSPDQTLLTNGATMQYDAPDGSGGFDTVTETTDPNLADDPATPTTVSVIEPQLQVFKDVHVHEGVDPTPPGNNYGLAGSDIYYVVTIAHTDASTATAYDVTINDPLPAAFDGAVVDSVSDSAGSPLGTGDFAIVSGALQFALGGDLLEDRVNIELGRTIEVTLRGTIAADVDPASWHDNQADIAWSSVDSEENQGPGNDEDQDDSDLSPFIDDGSDSERGDFDDQSNGVYVDDDNAAFSVPDFDKSIVTTSAAHTGTDQFTDAVDLTIGETVTYHLTATLPDDPTRAGGAGVPVLITDELPAGLEVVSVRVVSIGGNATVGATSGGDIASSSSNLEVGDDDSSPNITVSGQDISFDFGVVQVAHNDATNNGSFVGEDANRIVVEVVARAANAETNQNGSLLTNQGSFDFNDPGAPDGPNVLTESEDVDVVRPSVAIEKTFYNADGSAALADGEQVDAGDVLTVQLVVTNSGNSTAFDMEVVDQLSTFFDRSYVDTDATVEGTQPAAFSGTYDENGASPDFGLVSFDGGTLQPGESATLSFRVLVAQSVTPYQLETNTARITAATTLPDGDPEESFEGDVADPDDPSYQGIDEIGDPVPEGVDALSDDDSIAVPGVGIQKAFVSSSIPETSDDPGDGTPDLNIGEIATYQFLVTLPESQTASLTLLDLVPDGMQYVAGSARILTDPALLGESSPFGAFQFDGFILDADGNTLNNGDAIGTGVDGAAGGDTPPNDVEVTFGQIDTTATTLTPAQDQNNSFVVELQLVTLDVASNQSSTLLENIATVDVPTNPDEPEESNPVTVEVVDAQLGLDKIFFNATGTAEVEVVSAGTVVQIMLRLQNTGSGPAYDIEIRDPLNPSHFNAAGAVAVSTPAGFTFSKSGNTIVYQGDGPVMPGQTLEFRFAVQVLSSLPAGVYPNTAVIASVDSVPGDSDHQRDHSGDEGFDRLIIPSQPRPVAPPVEPPTPTGSVEFTYDVLDLYRDSDASDLFGNRLDDLILRMRQDIERVLPPPPIDFMATGIAERGSNISIQVFDENGVLIGSSTTLADAAGNWVVNFPNVVLESKPHHIKVQVDPATYNDSTIGEFNSRAYYTPALDAMHFASKAPNVGDVYRELAANVVRSEFEGNIRPFGGADGDWNQPFEYLATSYTEKL